MGCRSFTKGWKDKNGSLKSIQIRMNLGVVTVSLPQLLWNLKEMKFWEIFNERMKTLLKMLWFITGGDTKQPHLMHRFSNMELRKQLGQRAMTR